MSPARIPFSDLIGEQTRAEIFATVLTAGPISRTGLAQRLGLAASSVTRMLPPLLEHDYLRETDAAPQGRGRPQRMLQVNPDKHLVVGIKIGPAQVSAVVTDMAARVLARAERPIADCTPRTALTAAAELTTELLAQAPPAAEGPEAADRVLGIGVGVSGHVDSTAGICRYSALLDWQKVDVAGPLSQATGLPVVVNNDVNTLVVAERWFGEGRDVDSFAVVTVGPGIGCGLLLDGTLYAGASGMAGELGHLPLDPNGPMCSCGRRGCLEALAADRAVLRHIQDAGPADCPDIGAAVHLARHGSAGGRAVAAAAFAEAGTALGRGLAGVCNLLNLQKIIIAGEGAAAYDLFGPAMTAALDAHAFSDAARDCAIHVDPAHHDLWARGAACLVIRDAVRAPIS
ncbi:ROK family transcriptional regulator [Streptomyces sp. MZ04]|uniref:ROK family transcriptional regulator n=1 Tax=Streptomyces sp. MZ04 TaxID=2559236 RepID=UPI00107ECA67|nr:ROK family transcriptional regulator [Streptomyces sp. MZ04]TGB08874.1 ROK family transcriptional regulator [Streptomyces sp. MZ04]